MAESKDTKDTKTFVCGAFTSCLFVCEVSALLTFLKRLHLLDQASKAKWDMQSVCYVTVVVWRYIAQRKILELKFRWKIKWQKAKMTYRWLEHWVFWNDCPYCRKSHTLERIFVHLCFAQTRMPYWIVFVLIPWSLYVRQWWCNG